MLEELGLPYELKMLPFPPRVFAKEYLGINPLGTIPFMIDGETKMTESSGICHYAIISASNTGRRRWLSASTSRPTARS
jgi:glutathione S-transferase